VAVTRTWVTRLGLRPGLKVKLRAGNEAGGTARRHEAFATKPGKDRPDSSQVGHGRAPSQIDPPG
jgi:hypothetical protein